jgi:FtsZ-interacting cell division protein YlmF
VSGEWWNKIKQVIGIPGEDDDFYGIEEIADGGHVAVAEREEMPALAPLSQPTPAFSRAASQGRAPQRESGVNQMMGLSSVLTQSEVMIIEPKSFEDALAVVQSLRDHRAVIMNMKELTAELAQRLLDFVAGAAHALDGNQKQIGENIFLFSPSNVVINPLGTEQPWLNRDARDLFFRVK